MKYVIILKRKKYKNNKAGIALQKPNKYAINYALKEPKPKITKNVCY